MRTGTYAAALAALALVLAGCGGEPGAEPSPAPSTESATASATPSPSDVPSSSPAAPKPGSVPPPWLGTRVLKEDAEGYGIAGPTPPELRNRAWTLPDMLPMLPGDGFAAEVDVAPDDVIARSTWAPGCPVSRQELAWVRMTFWGFDGARHTGEMLINARVAEDVVGVFRRLYEARFPIEQMDITTKAALDAPPTGDGNGTGGFVCRPSVGQTSFSQHAYGLAIDINTFQNPYVKGDRVIPELARWYLDRSRKAPGMIHPDDVVVQAFADIGWEWGGDWNSLKDYQHFSENGT
ncbi:M15 family metallopeptidase [Nocardioides sp. KC13]|uniref:M15 family metallopeptidase n=1 Tax=Nocardioides turkmenicus TaxID=2711220 RepID=A0A6M1R9K3_9ACTN|nr:M15 family metallopeptidase [Nocardioides sp. KC13]